MFIHQYVDRKNIYESMLLKRHLLIHILILRTYISIRAGNNQEEKAKEVQVKEDFT